MVNIAVFAPISQGQCQHRCGREPRCAQETADGVTEIVAQNIHTA